MQENRKKEVMNQSRNPRNQSRPDPRPPVTPPQYQAETEAMVMPTPNESVDQAIRRARERADYRPPVNQPEPEVSENAIHEHVISTTLLAKTVERMEQDVRTIRNMMIWMVALTLIGSVVISVSVIEIAGHLVSFVNAINGTLNGGGTTFP